MNRSRDNNRGPAYDQWVIDRAAEVAEEQRQQAEAQAAADAADPVLAFQKASDAEAQAIRELILTGYVPESVLPVERIRGRQVNESAKISNWKHFATTCPTFQRWMAEQLIDTAFRSDIAPIAPAYLALHNLMLQYGVYVEPVQEVAPAVEEPAQQVLTPSEQFKVNQVKLDTVIGIVDGVEITERYLNSLPSRQELIIRRKLEKGHSGDSNFDEYLERRDVKFAMSQEIERKGEEL